MITTTVAVLLATLLGYWLGTFVQWRRAHRWYDTTQKYLRGQDEAIKAHEETAEAHQATIESLSGMCAEKDLLLETAHGAVKRLQETLKHNAQTMGTLRMQRDMLAASVVNHAKALESLGYVIDAEGNIQRKPEG